MEKPSFFAVLPAAVRYDARLSASEKIFFAEITALTEAEGYCYASNAYFCELYGARARTVQRWLEKLQATGYITVEPAAAGEGGHPRRIRLAGGTVRGADVDAAAAPGGDKNVAGGDKNVGGGVTKMSPPTSQEQNNNNNTGARAGAGEADREPPAKAPAAPSKTVDGVLAEFCFGHGDDPRLREALERFASARTARKKPLTPQAAVLICKRLARMAGEAEARDRVDYMVQVLEESTVNGWTGVFALKEYRPATPPPRPAGNGADRPRMIAPDADISELF